MSASHGLGWPPRDDAEGWQKSPIRVGRTTNNLGARRDRVFFTRHSGVTKISVQLVSEMPSMATAVGSFLGSPGNRSDHSSQRFGGVEERPTTEQNRKVSRSLFMDFVQRQAILHPAQACHHLKRSRSGDLQRGTGWARVRLESLWASLDRLPSQHRNLTPWRSTRQNEATKYATSSRQGYHRAGGGITQITRHGIEPTSTWQSLGSPPCLRMRGSSPRIGEHRPFLRSCIGECETFRRELPGFVHAAGVVAPAATSIMNATAPQSGAGAV